MEEIDAGENGHEPEKTKNLVLTITLLHENGQLSVQGPGNGKLFDEPMCFWLLLKAQRFIEVTNARQNQASIVVPKPRIRDIFRR